VKRLTLPNVRFTDVIYLEEHKLLSKGNFNNRLVHLWDLKVGILPQEIDSPQSQAVNCLFRPYGEKALRQNGFWPEEELLPSAFSDDPNFMPDVLQPTPSTRHRFFHPEGSIVVGSEWYSPSGFYHSRVSLRDAQGAIHELLLEFGYFTQSASFSPDGSLLAYSNGLKNVWVWDVATRQEVCQLTQTDKVNALTFLDNERIAVAAGRTVRVWDVRKQKVISKLPAFPKFVESLAVASDSSVFAAGSRDGSLRIWNAHTCSERGNYNWKIGQVQSIAFSPDGVTAAAAGDSGLVIWDID